MKIRMVGHASVILETTASGIWCDPWLTSKAFNNSWALWPEPKFNPDQYADIGYLWFSHEHPDHFNIPTLKSLDEAFKRRVTVLFQDRDSEKIFNALRNLGFANFKALPDGRAIHLSGGTEITIFQAGVNDSALAVRDNGKLVVNLNDCPFGPDDIRRMRASVGSPDVLLDQFSIAGNDGYHDGETLTRKAQSIPDSVCNAMEIFGAKRSIPFASFVYFCAIDNRDMNTSANSIIDVVEVYERRGKDYVILAPGDVYEVGATHDSSNAIQELEKAYNLIEKRPFDIPELIPIEKLKLNFANFMKTFSYRYPKFVRSKIGTLNFLLVDHATIVTLNFVTGDFAEKSTADPASIEIYSQPLNFGLTTPFGFETLAVSGRFKVLRDRKRWALLKRLTIASYQGLHFRSPEIFKPSNISYLARKLTNKVRGSTKSEPVWRRA